MFSLKNIIWYHLCEFIVRIIYNKFSRLSAYHQFHEDNTNDGLQGIVFVFRLRGLRFSFIELQEYTVQQSLSELTMKKVRK